MLAIPGDKTGSVMIRSCGKLVLLLLKDWGVYIIW